MTLTRKQRRQLAALAHHLNPVVMLGQHGLSEGVINELEVALDAHELIKVRVGAGDRDQRRDLIARLCDASGAELVQSIGHVAILYRRHRKNPKIKLV